MITFAPRVVVSPRRVMFPWATETINSDKTSDASYLPTTCLSRVESWLVDADEYMSVEHSVGM